MLWIVFGVLLVLGVTAIVAAFLAGRPKGTGSELDPPPEGPEGPEGPEASQGAQVRQGAR